MEGIEYFIALLDISQIHNINTCQVNTYKTDTFMHMYITIEIETLCIEVVPPDNI